LRACFLASEHRRQQSRHQSLRYHNLRHRYYHHHRTRTCSPPPPSVTTTMLSLAIEVATASAVKLVMTRCIRPNELNVGAAGRIAAGRGGFMPRLSSKRALIHADTWSTSRMSFASSYHSLPPRVFTTFARRSALV